MDLLGQPGSMPRNPTIASVLHDTKQAETKGSGIRVMREFMLKANLSPPAFDSRREHDQFTATFLLHHFLDGEEISWLGFFREENLSDDEARILIHARETEMVTNAICREYTGLDTLEVSRVLKRLRNIGLLEQHAHGQATYYSPTERLKNPESAPVMPVRSSVCPHERFDTTEEYSFETRDIPSQIQKLIQELGSRSPPERVQLVIIELCRFRPFSGDELAHLLRRDKKWIFKSYLKPLIREGFIEYTVPDNPKNPNQMYRIRDKKTHD